MRPLGLNTCSTLLAIGLAATLTAGPTWAEDSLIDEIRDSTDYKVEAYVSAFPMDQKGDTDDRSLELWSKWTATTSLELSDSLYFDSEFRLLGSTGAHAHRGFFSYPSDPDQSAQIADFDQIYLTFEADDFSITGGKALLPSGLSTLYAPMSRFNGGYTDYPMHTYDTGTWQLKLDYFIEDDTLSLAVTPGYTSITSSDSSNRWAGSSGNSRFNNLDLGANVDVNSLDTTVPTLAPKNWGYLAHYKAVREGYDFSLLAHHGRSIYPVVRSRTTEFPDIYFPMANTVAGSITKTIDEWEVHGEFSYQNTMHDDDQDFLIMVVGGSYRETELANHLGWDEIQPVIEFVREIATEDKVGSHIAADSRESRAYAQSLLTRLTLTFNDEWKSNIGFTKNFDGRDYILALGTEYKYSDNLTFHGAARAFHGEDDTYFGRWRRNSGFELGVEYKY